MKTIYYTPVMDTYRDMYYHPLFEDEVYIAPQKFLSYYKEEHIKHTYWKCHAWKNYYKNVYVIFSQQDITVKYDKESGIVDECSFKYFDFDEGTRGGGLPNVPIIVDMDRRHERVYSGLAVGQLNEHLFLWTKSKNKNLWVETLPPPNTIEKGMEMIIAEYPFSRWTRPLTFAYKFKNEDTKISRGEPIGLIKIKNFNSAEDSFSLEREDPPERLKTKSFNHATLKSFLPGKSWELIKDNTVSKCPFKNFF